MTEHEFKQLDKQHQQEGGMGTWAGFDVHASRGDWPFLALEGIIGKPSDSSDLRRHDLGKQLEIGALTVFKVWHLIHWLRLTALALAGISGTSVIWLVITNWRERIDLGSWTVASLVVGGLLFAAGLAAPALQWLNPQKAMRSWLIKCGLAVLGWIAANVHVRIFDPLFLKRGRLERLLNLPFE